MIIFLEGMKKIEQDQSNKKNLSRRGSRINKYKNKKEYNIVCVSIWYHSHYI